MTLARQLGGHWLLGGKLASRSAVYLSAVFCRPASTLLTRIAYGRGRFLALRTRLTAVGAEPLAGEAVTFLLLLPSVARTTRFGHALALES